MDNTTELELIYEDSFTKVYDKGFGKIDVVEKMKAPMMNVSTGNVPEHLRGLCYALGITFEVLQKRTVEEVKQTLRDKYAAMQPKK